MGLQAPNRFVSHRARSFFVVMHLLHMLVFTLANFDKPARESVLVFLTKQGYAAMFWSAVFFIVGIWNP
jgi:hypothetical protein